MYNLILKSRCYASLHTCMPAVTKVSKAFLCITMLHRSYPLLYNGVRQALPAKDVNAGIASHHCIHSSTVLLPLYKGS